MKQKQSSGQTTSKTVDKQESNSELITRSEVKNTPFQIISINENKEHFAVLGEYRVTEKYATKTVAEDEVKKITWNRLIQVIMIMNEQMKKTNINDIIVNK